MLTLTVDMSMCKRAERLYALIPPCASPQVPNALTIPRILGVVGCCLS